jgi:hypothetical protein
MCCLGGRGLKEGLSLAVQLLLVTGWVRGWGEERVGEVVLQLPPGGSGVSGSMCGVLQVALCVGTSG